MKKLFLILALSFTFILSACGESVPECTETQKLVDNECVELTEFEIAMKNMSEATSVTTEATIKDFPLLGDISTLMFYEDGKMKMDIYGELMYFYEEEGVTYSLASDGANGWIKEETDTSLEEEAGTDTDLSEDDFDFVDGKYVAKDTIDEMENLVLTITDGYVSRMEFTATEEGMTFDLVMVFSHYNNTTVTIPDHE